MRIHFVCSGNAFRSRLAEAYLKSKQLPNLDVSSSGTVATQDYDKNGPISWYAMRILKNNQLIPFMSKMSTQTTTELLNNSDFVVFMDQQHFDFAKNHLGFSGKNYEVWNIKDVDVIPSFSQATEIEKIHTTENIFEEIKEKVDRLVTKLGSLSS